LEKIFNQKNFNNFIWSPLGSRGNMYIKFLASSSLLGVCSLILFPLFATGVNDTGGKFAAGVVDTGGNLPSASLTPEANWPPVSLTPVANWPPVSTTQGEMAEKFAAGGVDTGGKFVAGVVDTGGNLSPVSLTLVVHLDMRISPRIFEKIRNDPNVIIRGLGEGDS
jgi:hypothetical protein